MRTKVQFDIELTVPVEIVKINRWKRSATVVVRIPDSKPIELAAGDLLEIRHTAGGTK